MHKILLFLLCTALPLCTAAQADTTERQASTFRFFDKQIDAAQSIYRFTWKNAVPPAVIVGMTAVQGTSWMKNINSAIKNKTQEFGFHNKADDWLQYSPAVAALALEAAGVKGQHRIGNKLIIVAMATLLEVAIVNGIKYSVGTLRPDGSSRNSFPSGHTATVFMAAEFLRLEYGHKSIWYTVGGYTMATAVGYMRIQNNRHWLSDVIGGAAVGIFSTQCAYWLYPYLHNAIFPKSANYSLMLMPYYAPQQYGIGATIVF